MTRPLPHRPGKGHALGSGRPLMERIEENIMMEPNTGCWLWIGSTVDGQGYPRISVSDRGDRRERKLLVRRLLYAHKFGEFPAELHLLHKGNVPLCVNPDHLSTYTRIGTGKGRKGNRQTNSFEIDGGIVYIDVGTKKYPGLVTLIDEEDLPLVIDGRGRWTANRATDNRFYVTREWRVGEDETTSRRLHRHLMGLGNDTPNVLVDHKDGDGLNNRRNNLRPATHRQNAANSIFRAPRSGFKGVLLHQRANGTVTYTAAINIFLGRFTTPEEAARAYDEAAFKTWGEFAKLNFPQKDV